VPRLGLVQDSLDLGVRLESGRYCRQQLNFSEPSLPDASIGIDVFDLQQST
jgi:hypothetical protein